MSEKIIALVDASIYAKSVCDLAACSIVRSIPLQAPSVPVPLLDF